MNKFQIKAKVLRNEKLSVSHYRLHLDAKSVMKKAKPGQFVHIQVNEGTDPYFRRPFGISRVKNSLEILYAVVGPGTKILSRKIKGDELDLLGPLGNPFAFPPQGVKQVVLIAGAIGIAPFFMLSDYLKNKKYETLLLYGVRNKSQVFNMNEFKQNGCRLYISTDDGSYGVKGRVSALFSKIHCDPERTFLYACGPKPMLDSVVSFAQANHLKGQVSAEEVMACGIGVCLGCATKTKAGYKTVCNDGPVFDISELSI